MTMNILAESTGQDHILECKRAHHLWSNINNRGNFKDQVSLMGDNNNTVLFSFQCIQNDIYNSISLCETLKLYSTCSNAL